MPALLFLLLFCDTFVTVGRRIVQTSGFSVTDDLHRLMGINLVLPHHHEHYSYALV